MVIEKIFGWFGGYEKIIDANKDVNGKGTFERYMEAYGNDVDTNIIPLIENLTQNIYDPERSMAKFLDYHEGLSGVLPLDFSRADPNSQAANEWMRRRLLRHIGKLLLIRGTRKGYDVLIRLIDPTVISITFQEYFTDTRYDTGIRFDDGHYYDAGICNTCPEYSLDIATETNTDTPTSYIQKAIKSIVAFNHPIDARIRYIKYNDTTITV